VSNRRPRLLVDSMDPSHPQDVVPEEEEEEVCQEVSRPCREEVEND